MFLAFPVLVLAMAVAAALGGGLINGVVALTAVWWMSYMRVSRGMVLELKNRDYVLASKAAGRRSRGILARVIMPNVVPTLLILAALDVGRAVLMFATLSYLGLGAKPPAPEWGSMVASGASRHGAVVGGDLPGSGDPRPRLCVQPVGRFDPRCDGSLGSRSPIAVTATEPLLEVKDLHVTINSAENRCEAVRGVSLRVTAGEVLGIVGESGCGKTLTVSAIAGLLPSGVHLASGSVRYKGEDLRAASRRRLSEIRGRDIAMVFQDSLTSLNPVLRIGAQVREPLLLHHMARGGAAQAAAQEGLRSVGIPDPDQAARRDTSTSLGRMRAMVATFTLPFEVASSAAADGADRGDRAGAEGVARWR